MDRFKSTELNSEPSNFFISIIALNQFQYTIFDGRPLVNYIIPGVYIEKATSLQELMKIKWKNE